MLIDFIQQIFNGLVVGSIYTLIALGLTTIFGILGIAHFAHGSVAMFGGYLTYFLISALGIGLLPSFILAMAAGALLGIILERVAYYPVRNAPPINSFLIWRRNAVTGNGGFGLAAAAATTPGASARAAIEGEQPRMAELLLEHNVVKQSAAPFAVAVGMAAGLMLRGNEFTPAL